MESTDQASLRSNIIVGVRVRPLTKNEVVYFPEPAVRVFNEHVLVFDPKDIKINRPGARPRDATFAFDNIFDECSTSLDVFNQTTKKLVEDVLEGFNCTCFAYGATGAGKTYTMIGNDLEPGVMVLTMEDLFKKISEDQEREYLVKISYLEVYNETIRDLLVKNSPPLSIRDNEGKEVVIAGLTSYTPISAKEVLHLLEQGNLRRSQMPTDANAQSSRSHAIFQVTVQHKHTVGGTSLAVRSGKLSLIDLAGSERAAQMHNTGQRLVEGANINKSLLALGNCINALGSGYRKGKYIPYRGSKLTRLLKDSLGGNCKTVMIANVSPSYLCYDDTWNTLQYANRAKNIQTNIWCNEKQVKYHVSQYRDLMSGMQDEINRLKAKSTTMEQQAIERANQQDMAVMESVAMSISNRTEDCMEAAGLLKNNHCNQNKLLHLLAKKTLELDRAQQSMASSHVVRLKEDIAEIQNKMRQNEHEANQIVASVTSSSVREQLRQSIEAEFQLVSNKALLNEQLAHYDLLVEKLNSSLKINHLEISLLREKLNNQALLGILQEQGLFAPDSLDQDTHPAPRRCHMCPPPDWWG